MNQMNLGQMGAQSSSFVSRGPPQPKMSHMTPQSHQRLVNNASGNMLSLQSIGKMNKPKVAGATSTQSSQGTIGASGPSASRLSTGGLDTSSQ